MSSQRSSISFTPPLMISLCTDTLICSVVALRVLWFELRSLWVAGSDRESAELQGQLGISRSPETGCHTNPRDSEPSVSRPLVQGNRSSGRGGRELPWTDSWGRKRQEQSTVRFTDSMGSVGGGNLVVNRNRWASSQEKRWKKKKKTFFGRMVGTKDRKLREGEASSFLRRDTCL